MDAGFKLNELMHAGLTGFVLRMQSNCTARRSDLPANKERGKRPQFGPLVRPLVRTHLKNKLAARPDCDIPA